MVSSEDSPLLSPSANAAQPEVEAAKLFPRKTSPARIVRLILLYVVAFNFAIELFIPAETRVLEQIYCTQYYRHFDPSLIGSDGNGGIDERWCKVTPVQSNVAMLRSWQTSFGNIAMLVTSVPWSYAADKYGRKPVFLALAIAKFARIAYIQLICSFGGAVSLKWTWLSALFVAFGTSPAVTNAMIYIIISDVITESERAATFFQVMGASMVPKFLGLLSSAALMRWNPWLPMLIALAVEAIGLAIAVLTPETLNYKISSEPHVRRSSNASRTALNNNNTPQRRTIFWCGDTFSSFPVPNYRVGLIISIFLSRVPLQHEQLIPQYISTRYSISLSSATALTAVQSGLVVILCIVIIPSVNRRHRDKIVVQRHDLLFSRISAGVIFLTFLGVALAPNLLLLASALLLSSFGWGFWSFLRSLLSSLAEAHSVARLYTLVAVIEAVGHTVGNPLLAFLFTRGLEIRGWLYGLPFLVCSFIMLVHILSLMAL
ncbi:major facilitator superfamily domain-containing protein [Xylaria intraflava]|nr:major facilitator superfamily domain-containing protein [Xylaria intraflava]